MTPPSPLELAVEALEFYRDEWAEHRAVTSRPTLSLSVDGGQRAAIALAAIRQEGVTVYPVAEGAARSVDAAMAEAKLSSDWRAAIKKVAISVLEHVPVIVSDERRISLAEAIAFSHRLDAFDAPPTDRAGPSATDYDPKPFIGGYFTDRVNAGDRSNIAGAAQEYGDEVPSTPPPDRGADVEAEAALISYLSDLPEYLHERISRSPDTMFKAGYRLASDRLAAPGWRPTHQQVKRALQNAFSWRGVEWFDQLHGAVLAVLALKPPPPTDEMR